MYGKVILTLTLLAFVSVQLGESLECKTCDNVNACKTPSTVKCDQGAADKTRSVLDQYYNDVKSLDTLEFACFVSSTAFKNGDTMAVQGCIVKGAIECSNSLKDPTYTTHRCYICDESCNDESSNSVSVISSSIVAVILELVLAKVLDI